MVIAGPGSGKTTVLTRRIDTLVRRYGVPPEKILVITFTRAAAEEMKARYLMLSGSAGDKVSFGTFHSVFFRILKVRYGYESSQILREGEKRRILESVLSETLPGEHADSERAPPVFFCTEKPGSGGRKPGERRNLPKIRGG